MERWGARDVAYAGVIAAFYAVLTIILAPLSFGVYQVRVAEALTVLPFIMRSAPIGLFVGCMIANIYGGNGLADIIFGSLFTLIAGYLTYAASKIKQRELALIVAPLPPVIINAFGVAIYLSRIMGMPYLFVVQMVGIGQLVSCYVIGLPLLILVSSRLPGLSHSLSRSD